MVVIFFYFPLLSPIASIFGSGALCVARTFLSPSQESQRQGRETAFLSAKLDFFHENHNYTSKKSLFTSFISQIACHSYAPALQKQH